MRTAVLVILAASASACVTQRSLTVGQMASAVGKGAADVSVFTGVLYQSQSAPPVSGKDGAGDPFSSQVNSTGVSLPWFEANVNYGFGEHFTLNAHMSPAGFQPGAKITLNKSRVASIALLPEVGIGYFQYSENTGSSGANGVTTLSNPNSTSQLIFLGGLKFLISHRSGFFLGLGYTFNFTRAVQNSVTGTAQTLVYHQTVLTSLQHQIGLGVGMSIKVGFLSIRPEIAFAVVPAISGTRTIDGTNAYSASGGFSWALLPGFGFALTSPKNEYDPKAEEDEKNVGETEDRPEREREVEDDPPPRNRDDE